MFKVETKQDINMSLDTIHSHGAHRLEKTPTWMRQAAEGLKRKRMEEQATEAGPSGQPEDR